MAVLMAVAASSAVAVRQPAAMLPLAAQHLGLHVRRRLFDTTSGALTLNG